MANFINAFMITMNNEGGYANNPNDIGGETYAGIVRRFWPNWPGWTIIEPIVSQNPPNLDEALKTAPGLQAMVEAFYQENYWNTLSLTLLNCQQLANQLFDAGVNMGIKEAGLFLQQAICAISPGAIAIDDLVGPDTITAANQQDDEALYNQVIAMRKQRYEEIIAANPSQAEFQNSWFSRLTPFVPLSST